MPDRTKRVGIACDACRVLLEEHFSSVRWNPEKYSCGTIEDTVNMIVTWLNEQVEGGPQISTDDVLKALANRHGFTMLYDFISQ